MMVTEDYEPQGTLKNRRVKGSSTTVTHDWSGLIDRGWIDEMGPLKDAKEKIAPNYTWWSG